MRRIVDAHHHLWDLNACRYPWLEARGVKRFFGDPMPIQKNYLVDDLRADAADYELVASVHVQVGVAPGDEVNETTWLQRTADREGLPSAIIAFCELDKDDAMSRIEAHKSHTRVRGIRQIVGRSAEEDAVTGSAGLLQNVAWKENLAALGELRLSFDLQLIPPQIPDAVDVLAQVSTPIALCHCGSPWDQTAGGLLAWHEGMRLLSELPNVSCKISGLGMFDHHWTVDSISPIVESCIDLFGAERCMFGSNFPVDKLHATYSRVWSAYEDITAGLPERELAQLFRETALEFYRIDSAS